MIPIRSPGGRARVPNREKTWFLSETFFRDKRFGFDEFYIRRNPVDKVVPCEGAGAAAPDQVHLDQVDFGRQSQTIGANVAEVECIAGICSVLRTGGSPTVLLGVLKAKLAEALLRGKGSRLCSVWAASKTHPTITAGAGRMVHSGVWDNEHPHGQGGGGSAFVLESNSDADRGCDFEGGGRSKAALRPQRRTCPQRLSYPRTCSRGESLRGATVEQRHISILKCHGHATVQGDVRRK